MTVFIGVYGLKGGVGKTTLCINLASALVLFGRDVIIVDCHFQKPNISLYLGLHDYSKSIHSALLGSHHISEAIIVHPSGLQIIPGGNPEKTLEISREKLEHMFMDLMQKTEMVLLDSSSDLNEAINTLSICDHVLLTTTSDLVSFSDTAKAAKKLSENGISILGVVLTRYNQKNQTYSIPHIESIIGYPVIGIIVDDDMILKAQELQYPRPYTHYTTPATISYKKLAANIIGQPYEESISQKETFIEFLLKRLGFTKP